MNTVANTGMFRARSSILGDIIGSAPTYAGTPAASIADTGYSTFYNTYSGRTPMVYVGANDGMLHAFNANTGAEVFAYVPNAVFSNLNQLTSVSYAHQLYVDATRASAKRRSTASGVPFLPAASAVVHRASTRWTSPTRPAPRKRRFPRRTSCGSSRTRTMRTWAT